VQLVENSEQLERSYHEREKERVPFANGIQKK